MVILKVITLLTVVFGFAGFIIPEEPKGYVNDYANALRPETNQLLEKLFARFEKNTGHQTLVAIFTTLEEKKIDGVAKELFRKWRLGHHRRNDGILLVFAMKEQAVRMEIGHGLEPNIPDALVTKILEKDIFPFLKQNQVATALLSFERRLEEIFQNDQSDVYKHNKDTVFLYAIFIGFLLLAFLRDIIFYVASWVLSSLVLR